MIRYKLGDVRHTQSEIETWRCDGCIILRHFFAPEEISEVYTDYQRIYGTRGQHCVERSAGAGAEDVKMFRDEQFQNMDTLPYRGSAQMNLLSLHPSLIHLAKDLLGVGKVFLYQSHTWAKFTGNANYEQPMHCDYKNHTLLVPADQPSLRTVNFVIYVSEVTDDLGALHYVTKRESNEVLGVGSVNPSSEDDQAALMKVERSAASEAGSLVVYGIDTFHRGTNLTKPQGRRYTMTVSFKARGNDGIGFHVWYVITCMLSRVCYLMSIISCIVYMLLHPMDGNRQHSFHRQHAWQLLLQHASPEQLVCIGIPLPGDPFWTERTLDQTQQRWSQWYMREYTEALISKSPEEYERMCARYDYMTNARQITAQQAVRKLSDNDIVLLDVRGKDEYSIGIIPSSIHLEANLLILMNSFIPLWLRTRLFSSFKTPVPVPAAIPEDKTVVCTCTAGLRSGYAAVELERLLQRPVFSLHGGVIAWVRHQN